MTKKELKKAIDKLEKERAAEDKDAWIMDHIEWLGCDLDKAENDYLKHQTFIEATLNLYKKQLKA